MDKNIDKLHYYRSYARVNLACIRNNFDELKKLLAPETKTMAVVKADGYGHGSVAVAKTLEGRADYFAVADIAEAVELRKNGIKTPILILSYTSPYQYEQMIDLGITATVYSLSDAKTISETAKKLGKTALIHVAVDTGMSRVGFKDCYESAEIIKEISELTSLLKVFSAIMPVQIVLIKLLQQNRKTDLMLLLPCLRNSVLIFRLNISVTVQV